MQLLARALLQSASAVGGAAATRLPHLQLGALQAELRILPALSGPFQIMQPGVAQLVQGCRGFAAASNGEKDPSQDQHGGQVTQGGHSEGEKDSGNSGHKNETEIGANKMALTTRPSPFEDSEPNNTSSGGRESGQWERVHSRSFLAGKPAPKYNLLQAMGGVAAAAGGGLLAYRHLWPCLTVDVVSAGMVVAGMLTVAAAQQTQAQGPWPKTRKPARFKFQLLNDEVRFQKEHEDLKTMLDQPLQVPSEAHQKLRAAKQLEALEAKTRAEETQKLIAMDINRMLDSEKASPADVGKMLRAKVFVIDFCDRGSPSRAGSRKSTEQLVQEFGDKVSLVISIASKFDRVVVKVTSPGGAVIDYGLAGSHMLRLKAAGLKVTACVDTVAASGGYMMACVADRLVAAPFAFLGSIGVVSQMINVHKVLKRNEVDTLLFTAGKFKRTVTPFTETTQEAIDKVQQDVEEIHNAFKEHVYTSREELKGTIEEVATGEVWLGMQAKAKGLVDAIMTSEAYLRTAMVEYDVLLVTTAKRKPTLRDLLNNSMADASAALHALGGGWLGSLLAAGPVSPSPAESYSFHQTGGLHDPTSDTQFRQPY
eukprot:CAMPEP_0117685032 /NCGR_PEP_ID=MMETSP0804-20121206/21499_1 /TAXON_ID=1074897 /ORGANISM="Tetraselmis astigmatica, Strain CCMP880" /LENGTH=594 /DNA_ID=CAMNT_0005496229 /DNA_START=74 /DNA_END=1858 /DNA_ORIENTATION=+